MVWICPRGGRDPDSADSLRLRSTNYNLRSPGAIVSNTRIQQLRFCNVGIAADGIAIPESRDPSVQEGLGKIGIESDRLVEIQDRRS